LHKIFLRTVAEIDHFAAEPQKEFEFLFKVIKARREIATAEKDFVLLFKPIAWSSEAICPKII